MPLVIASLRPNCPLDESLCNVTGTIPSSCFPPVKPCACLPVGSFRIDYCFLAEQSKNIWPVHSAVELIDLSDHMPLIVDFERRDPYEEQPRILRRQFLCPGAHICIMCVILVSILIGIGLTVLLIAV